MRLGPVVLLAFIAIPIFEVWLLIEVGGIIGALPTIALVVLTAIVGMALIRRQGVEALRRAQLSADRGEPPVGAVVDGIFLLLAGALLLTPGFFTDTIGFLCLVPALRRRVAAQLWARFGDKIVIRTNQRRDGERPRPGGPGPVIEGEFEEVQRNDPDETSRRRDDSPWRGGEQP